jgi:hypothetical protein
MAASTPEVMIERKYVSASSNSGVNTSVLKVTYPRTPRRCRSSINFGRSAMVKLFARIRALNRSNPK